MARVGPQRHREKKMSYWHLCNYNVIRTPVKLLLMQTCAEFEPKAVVTDHVRHAWMCDSTVAWSSSSPAAPVVNHHHHLALSLSLSPVLLINIPQQNLLAWSLSTLCSAEGGSERFVICTVRVVIVCCHLYWVGKESRDFVYSFQANSLYLLYYIVDIILFMLYLARYV